MGGEGKGDGRPLHFFQPCECVMLIDITTRPRKRLIQNSHFVFKIKSFFLNVIHGYDKRSNSKGELETRSFCIQTLTGLSTTDKGTTAQAS